MKVRHGFVSNSSSTSFVIVGFNLSKDEVVELDYKVTGELKDIKHFEDGWYDNIFDGNDEFSKGLYTNAIEYSDEIVVGYGNYGEEHSTMDLTVLEENIERAKKLKEKYGIEKDIEVHYGGGYNG